VGESKKSAEEAVQILGTNGNEIIGKRRRKQETKPIFHQRMRFPRNRRPRKVTKKMDHEGIGGGGIKGKGEIGGAGPRRVQAMWWS